MSGLLVYDRDIHFFPWPCLSMAGNFLLDGDGRHEKLWVAGGVSSHTKDRSPWIHQGSTCLESSFLKATLYVSVLLECSSTSSYWKQAVLPWQFGGSEPSACLLVSTGPWLPLHGFLATLFCLSNACPALLGSKSGSFYSGISSLHSSVRILLSHNLVNLVAWISTFFLHWAPPSLTDSHS